MSCRRIKPPARQRGAALVLALLVFAVSAALIVAMRANFDRVYQQASGLFIAEQSRAYLRGAEGLATLALLIDYDADQRDPPGTDTLNDFWARETTPYALDEGWLIGHLVDLQGRFNLNLLVEEEPAPEQDGPRFNLPQAQFVRLILAVTDPPMPEAEAMSVAKAVSDWVDPDSNLRPDGAEDDYYLTRDPAHRAANRPMRSVSELLAVRGVTPELYAALEPWVTVWPERPGKLNIETAPVTVLRSLRVGESLQPLSRDEALGLARMRCEEPFESVEAFLQQGPFAGDDQAAREALKELLAQQSSYFLLQAEAEVAGRQRRLYSVLQRENRQVSILSRTIDERVTPLDLEREDPCER